MFTPFVFTYPSLIIPFQTAIPVPRPEPSAAARHGAFTMDQAVRLALANNPRAQAVLAEIRSSQSGVDSARALANPELLLVPALIHRIGSDEELLFRQPLELNGTRAARTGVAEARLRRVRAESLGELRGLVYETKSAYLLLSRANAKRVLAQDLAKSAEEVARLAGRQVELGNRPGVERTQTSVEARRALQQSRLAEADFQSALFALNALIGKNLDNEQPLADIAFEPQPIDVEAFTSQALTLRSELLAIDARRDEFKQEARFAKAQGKVDLVPQIRAESLTRDPRNVGIGLGISLPIFDYGSRRNRVREAEEATKAQEARRLDAQNRVRSEVGQAVARLQAAEAVVAEYRDGLLEETKRLYDSSREGFRLGQTSVVSLLEAQRTYRTVQNEYIEALISHALARVEIERATGAAPTTSTKETQK